MRPRHWALIHFVSFFFLLLSIGALLTSLTDMAMPNYDLQFSAALLLFIVMHLASSPNQSWVNKVKRDN